MCLSTFPRKKSNLFLHAPTKSLAMAFSLK